MRITVTHTPTRPIEEIYLHAWDDNGLVLHVPGARQGKSNTFTFVLSGATRDQREVKFKYYYPRDPDPWERDDFIRVVPTLEAENLWTYDFSPRCLTKSPESGAHIGQVTVHTLTAHRFRGGRLFVWNPYAAGNSSRLIDETRRDDQQSLSHFVVPLDDVIRPGFHFKLVAAGNTQDAANWEADSMNRLWRPSDGADLWIKSGQINVRGEKFQRIDSQIHFFHPAAFGQPSLHVRDTSGDFDETLVATAARTAIAGLSRSDFVAGIYPGSLYEVWASTEPYDTRRLFRIPLDSQAIESFAVNGHDHWIGGEPQKGQVNLVVHPNPSSTFGNTLEIRAGIGYADAHATVTANRQPDGTWKAPLDTLLSVPFWAAITGESRPDGPLDFRRVFITDKVPLTLHTIDGVGGLSKDPPRAFRDIPQAQRRDWMAAVYGSAIVDSGTFDAWEMPQGTCHAADEVRFVLRAPHAVTADLVLLQGDGHAPARTVVPMALTDDLRYFWGSVPKSNAKHGSRYRFSLRGCGIADSTNSPLEVLDPASRWALDQGHLVVDPGSGPTQSWSRVVDPAIVENAFAGSVWRTMGWEALLIYELHADRFTKRNSDAVGTPFPAFSQVASECVRADGYLAQLPVTTLELLPVHEFPSQQSWGYNPSLFFAVESSYGGPEEFARAVRASHNSGRAVILDVVFNHMMESPLQLVGRDVYVNGETAWGDMVGYAHPVTREFFRQALVHLWRTYRLDGFRFDSTETIINGHRTDTGSAPFILGRDRDGNLRPGAGGGWEFLGILKTALHRAATAIGQPWPFLVGENDPLNEGMTDPAWGVLDGQWWFPGMYALGNAAYDQDDKADDVAGSLIALDSPFQRSVLYGESHDSVSAQNNQQRIAAREAWGFGRQMAKAVGAVSLLSESVPMLFMGEEGAEVRPFAFGASPSDPNYLLKPENYLVNGSEPNRVLTWFSHLMGLRNNPGNALRGGDHQWVGRGRKTIAFTRADGRFFVIVTFGTGDRQQDLSWLGLPQGGTYKEIFNSSWPTYSVSGEPESGNGGYDARLHTGNIVRLPSIGAVVLERC